MSESMKLKFEQDDSFKAEQKIDGSVKRWLDFKNGTLTFSVEGFVTTIKNIIELDATVAQLDEFVSRVSVKAKSVSHGKMAAPIKIHGILDESLFLTYDEEKQQEKIASKKEAFKLKRADSSRKCRGAGKALGEE